VVADPLLEVSRPARRIVRGRHGSNHRRLGAVIPARRRHDGCDDRYHDCQCDRDRDRTAPKLASPYARDEDFVFATGTGRPMYYRNASARGLDERAKRAGLNADPSLPKLPFHDLRHSAISHLIRSGADVVRVQRFAGHRKPSTTLDIYAHEFRAREGDDIRQRLAIAFEGVL
jgi:integrase